MSHDLIDFVQRWDRRAPLVMHCYAGISRSTAGAFITACALNPRPRRGGDRAGASAALADRHAEHHARRRIADRMLGRNGRMIAAVEALGPGTAGAAKANRSGSIWNDP